MEFHTLIDADSLQELLDRQRPVIVDCRFDLANPEAGRQAYLSGHIPGARYADLNRDLSGPIGPSTGRHPLPGPETFAAWLSANGMDNGTQVIVYDAANGSIAARLWWMLRWAGHEAVAVLDGGIKAWTARGGALQSGPPESPRAGGDTPPTRGEPSAGSGARRFTPRIAADTVLGTAELERALQDPRAMLVDARAQERYAGTVEPIDPVAGHIPGAVNHPFTANLDADGFFLPAAEIRRRWLERLAGKNPESVIAMCGSGVTACHNLLSLEVAGLRGAKLYAGSWSEWIRDPRRPVARS
jgi:thiosulfate/3-mercaptopyruvate sulfurtransferase